MLRQTKLASLGVLQKSGVFPLIATSRWRRERLLILCYHGISLEDEHLWRPKLYMPLPVLESRLEMLRRLDYSVLPLGEALERLQRRDLPPRSVVITFDDGTYDFYTQAYPALKRFGFPVTVYQTTYYTDHELPIFNLTCSYMLWKKRTQTLNGGQLGISGPVDLSTEMGRHRVVRALIDLSEREKLSGAQKNDLVLRLASALGFDYEEFTSKRMLQLMNAREVQEVGNNGVNLQLHTHRHRTPDQETAFRREIADNRERIRSLTGQVPVHFCYPGGIYRKEFAGWLEKEKVVSAATCDAGLVSRDSNPYLLARFVDTLGRTQVEFESWLSGVGSLAALRRAAPQRYIVPDD